MTRYFANSAATRKNRPLTTGYATEADSRAQAEFLAGYGGIVMVTTNEGILVGKFPRRAAGTKMTMTRPRKQRILERAGLKFVSGWLPIKAAIDVSQQIKDAEALVDAALPKVKS